MCQCSSLPRVAKGRWRGTTCRGLRRAKWTGATRAYITHYVVHILYMAGITATFVFLGCCVFLSGFLCFLTACCFILFSSKPPPPPTLNAESHDLVHRPAHGVLPVNKDPGATAAKYNRSKHFRVV